MATQGDLCFYMSFRIDFHSSTKKSHRHFNFLIEKEMDILTAGLSHMSTHAGPRPRQATETGISAKVCYVDGENSVTEGITADSKGLH